MTCAIAFPEYRAERLRAETAEARATVAETLLIQERRQTEQEQQRAERYAALLKIAGLLPPEDK